jgi:surfactin synthase thioesterase subunit/phosphopantetheinyl transferase
VQVVAIQLPGREERAAEPPFARLQPLVGAILAALRPHLIPPYAFFGHSMGALVAFEVARQLPLLGCPPPVRLIVSGRHAPTRPGPVLPNAALSDNELRDWLLGYRGTPDAVLANSEFLQFLLPTLRADIAVCAKYRYMPGEPLACPLTALAGEDDPDLDSDDLLAWREQTNSTFSAHRLSGDHFYLKRNPEFFAFLAEILSGGDCRSTDEWQAPPRALALNDGEVHLWFAPLPQPAEVFEELAASCTEDERCRASRLLLEAPRRDFLAAHGILRRILARYLGEPPRAITMTTESAGKPELKAQKGQVPIRFNLSHTSGGLLVGVTRGADIGVDLERLRPMSDAVRIAQQFFALQECQAVERADNDLREGVFFRCWTRKEAYLKARGDGLSFPLDRFAVSLDEVPRLLWMDGEPLAAVEWWLAEVRPEPDYLGAVAVRRPGAILRLWRWSPCSVQ